MEVMRVSLEWFLDNGGHEMAHTHHAEVDANDTELDFEAYAAMEANDCLMLLVAWDAEAGMVGYTSAVAQPSIHSKGNWECTTTAFYTRPEFRKTGVGRLLYDTLYQLCEQHGIEGLHYVVSEAIPEVHEAVKALGMVKAETTYSIRIRK